MIETRRRNKVALFVESGEAREVHHICVLLGYGADAICPYLALELASSLRDQGVLDTGLSDEAIYLNYAQAMQTGISKVMAKMGISTLQSYKGAQIFEAVGLAEDVIEKCFKGTPSRLGKFELNRGGIVGVELNKSRLMYDFFYWNTCLEKFFRTKI